MSKKQDEQRAFDALIKALVPEKTTPKAFVVNEVNPRAKPQFNVGDRVQIINDPRERVFVVYSYTVYAEDRITYTLWFEDDYDMFEPWQLKQYLPPNPIGFNDSSTQPDIQPKVKRLSRSKNNNKG